MKTSELSGPALDWAVGQCPGEWPVLIYLGHVFLREGEREVVEDHATVLLWQRSERWSPSTDWAQGGPIIERERLHLCPVIDVDDKGYKWGAWVDVPPFRDKWFGPTPLVAAMRCYVASKFGDEVDVPEELL